MATSATRPEPASLRRDQRERRQRIIDAAEALMFDVDYEKIQVKDVADRAEVALGTLYRYFGSKDDLLSSAMAAWSGDLRGRLNQRPPSGDSPVDRVVSVMRRASRALEHEPRLSEALVKSLFSHEPGVAEANGEVSMNIHAMLAPILDDLDPAIRDGLIDLIAQVWHSSLIGWANGRFPIREIGVRMERAVRLILEPRYSALGAGAIR